MVVACIAGKGIVKVASFVGKIFVIRDSNKLFTPRKITYTVYNPHARPRTISSPYLVLHVGEVDSPEQSDNVHIRHSKMGGNKIEIYHLENRAINFGIPENDSLLFQQFVHNNTVIHMV